MTNDEHLRVYATGVREICELVDEMFGENKVTLLSPVLREVVRRRAKEVLEEHHLITCYLQVWDGVDLDKVKEVRGKPPIGSQESGVRA